MRGTYLILKWKLPLLEKKKTSKLKLCSSLLEVKHYAALIFN